ncbi:DUF1552 domain-containing protein [Stieleria sp. TO1_6]|uniref:DUF1552 domain-containing protein n=1 Tax=Stieleria tagensis TaxID=2956795 RepID=UPI00209B5F11|nr:DUF1552 domain-containing protein [Stieleria tagensis]MCO8120722.1 DUF1552 domain-containing protein [Stieleria tagensis]
MNRPDSARLRRRSLLRAAGVSIALPAFASLRGQAEAAPSNGKNPQRMVCIGNMLGFYPEAFWPQHDSETLSTTLASLADHKRDMTVIGGLDHGLKGGHFSIHAFLSGVRNVDAKSMPDGNMTLDQAAAETIGGQTRFASLTVGSDSGIHGGCQMSWSRAGTRVPPITGPGQLFEKLFVGIAPKDQQKAADRFRMKASILDAVGGDARSIARELNSRDRNKLDEYLTSIREVEQRLENSKQWVDIEKPTAPFDRPTKTNMVDDLPMLYDLITLALQTDSTRIATLEIGGDFEARDFGYRSGYHSLSHHGQRQDAIDALIKIESYQVEQFSRFLTKLRESEIGDSNLLDQTSVLFGSGMGNANSHTNTNLPIVLAGGGYRHQGTMWFDKNSPHRPPLTNLYLTMLQRFGVQTERFSTSTGTLRGLEWV